MHVLLRDLYTLPFRKVSFYSLNFNEPPESDLFDVIKIRLKLGNPSFKISRSTLFKYKAAGFLSHFSMHLSFLDVFLCRHTCHFPALRMNDK